MCRRGRDGVCRDWTNRTNQATRTSPHQNTHLTSLHGSYLLGLLRQLARGRQHERLRVGRGRVQHLEDAHGKHRRFPGSRLVMGW